jgi:drug/metabolite transporter (DMT)-like permease
MRSRTTFGIVCCATAMTILGASVAVSREILELPVFYAQAARYAVAAAILGAIATRQPRVATADLAVAPSPRWRTVGRLALLAATGLVLFNVVVLAALRRADPEVLGSVIGCTPLALAAAGPIQQRRRPETRLLQAAAVVVVGAAIVQGTGRTSLTGLLLAVAALACEAAFSLVAAPLLPRLGAVRVSAAACAIAIPMLLVAGLLAGERWRSPTGTELAALGYLAVFLTAGAFVVWYTGIGNLGVERAGLFAGLVPVASLAAAAVLDRTRPGPGPAIGVLLVGAGIALGLRSGPRPAEIRSSGRAAAARKEAVDVDQHAHDLADRDESPLVGGGDGEREPAAIDLRQHGLGDDLGTDRRRLQVVEPDVHADGGVALDELGGDRAAARLLAERDEARGAEHVDRAGAESARRVGIGHDHLCFASDSGRDSHNDPRYPRVAPGEPTGGRST